MSRLGIVAAMHEELRAVLACLPDERRIERAGRDFWVGHLDGHEVVAVLSRIGKVAAATTATLLCSGFDVDRVVVTGTAGGLHDDVAVGDIVVAEALLQHDMDASPIFPRYEVPLYGLDRFATDAVLTTRLAAAAGDVAGAMSAASPARADAALALDLAPDAALLAGFGIVAPRVHRGLVLSGDRFVADAATGGALRRAFPAALAVEMEGAAIAQVCHDFAVPCAVVRTVSDRADDAATVDFQRFVEAVACRCTLAVVRRFLVSSRPAPTGGDAILGHAS